MSSTARLVEGEPRLGWFIDGDQSTPDVNVTLEDTGDRIRVNIPTKGLSDRGPYRRWMSGFAFWGDDPDKTKYSYAPPSTCLFKDHIGSVVLVGCHERGGRDSLTGGVVHLDVDHAVLTGNNLNYSALNGVRSTLPALAEWTGLRSVHTDEETDERGRVKTVTVRLESPASTKLSQRMNLTLRPTWRTSYPDNEGTFAAHNVVELRTATQAPRPWEDHLDPHRAIRDLLVLSAWRPLGFSQLLVNRGDDPRRLLNGDAIEERWADVQTYRLPSHTPWKGGLEFLFRYVDIGATGVRRWLSLREGFRRAIEPLLGIADNRIRTLDTAVVSSGIALEALGYQLAVDAKAVDPAKRQQLRFPRALQWILDDMPYWPLEDPESWKVRAATAYNGVKHADNSTPDAVFLLNTMRENAFMIRCWLASRLGMRKAVLETRAKNDQLAQPYE